MALATFCRVLAEVNKGNAAIIDELPTNFTNYNKVVLKECLFGQDGSLLKYAHMYSNSSNY